MAKPKPVLDSLARILNLHERIRKAAVNAPLEDDGTINEVARLEILGSATYMRIMAEKIVLECSTDVGKHLQYEGMSLGALNSIEEELADDPLPDPHAVTLLAEVRRLRAWATLDMSSGIRTPNAIALPE